MAVHEGLGLLDILKPRETVLFSHVGETGLVHQSGQPFSAVETNLNVEREPRLDAAVHEAEERMDEVVIEVEAFSEAGDKSKLLFVAPARDIERVAGLNTGNHADEAPVHPILERRFTGHSFFADSAGLKIDNLPRVLRSYACRSLFQLSAHPLHVLAELLEEDPLGMQVTLHPVWVYNLSESTLEERDGQNH